MPLLNVNTNIPFKETKSENKRTTANICRLVCVLSASAPLTLVASPWLEANDPFIRSSLVLLSDAGQLSSPVNHYPLRWSVFADDLYTDALYKGIGEENQVENDLIINANRELLYTLNSAKLNRGNRAVKVLSGSNNAPSSGFGQFNEDEKGIYTSVEQLGSSVSYRISAGYSEYQNDTDYRFDDSYLAVSSGAMLWSIGNVDRWWGQGWQHNLILGSYAKAAPDISVSYVGENDLLGVWSLETLLAEPSNRDYDYHSATRLVSKPFRAFEYGVTYQAWLTDTEVVDGGTQLALDAKLTLPRVANLYHSVYSEVASTTSSSTSSNTEMGAWLVGWTGSFPMGKTTARIVVESQQSNDARDTSHYLSVTDDVANTTYLLDSSASVALYLQFIDDHQLGLMMQRSTEDDETTHTSQLTYRLPALSGMVRFGASYAQNEVSDNDTSLWAGYEFRF